MNEPRMRHGLGALGMIVLLLALLNPPSSLADRLDVDRANDTQPQAEAQVPADWWVAVQAEIEQAEYQITWQEQTYLPDLPAAYQAPNRAENLRTYFGPAGPILIPRLWPEEMDGPPWRWELRLEEWGREGAMQPVETAELEVHGNQAEYRRAALVEWYRNDVEGLALGFRVGRPPEAASNAPLRLALSWGGDLAAQGDDGPGVAFVAGEAVVLRLGSLSARDATGRPLEVQRLMGDGMLRLQVDDTGATYPLELAAVISGLPATADWTLAWGATNTDFGYSVATAGDVNGDSYSDVIIGAPGFDGGQTNEGKAFVFLGYVLGLSGSPAWSKEPNQAEAQFGSSVASAGDVNGDGYADVIVGAPGWSDGQSDEGGAWVYHGAASGVNSAPNWYAQGNQINGQFGCSVATAGDVNGDGYADVIISAPDYDAPTPDEGAAFVWHGSAGGVNGGVNGSPSNAAWHAESDEAVARLGYSVASAGDVNGDGQADVIVGAYLYGGADEGAAMAWYGRSDGVNHGVTGTPANAAWMVTGAHGDAWLGLSVAGAGDVNGDGFADVIVGDPYFTNGQTEEGGAYLYLGSAAGLGADWANRDEGDKAGARLGYSVASVGDVNGDGYADVVVGAPRYTNDQSEEGRAFLWYGSASGISTTRDWWAEGNVASAWYGSSVATAGDVNGDGYSDLIVGAYGDGSRAGTVYVYHGAPDMPHETPNWTKRSNQEDAHFGFSVSSAGDVNGDGFADIIIGAPQWDSGQANEGGAWIYRGDAGGLVSTPYWYKQSDSTGALFGWSVASAGDVNGDGYADVIVGAPGYDHPQVDEGGAWIYHGAASGVSSTPVWHKESDQGGAQFGASLGTAGDVNGDGYSDVVVGAPYWQTGGESRGAVWLYYGSASGTHGAPDWYQAGNQQDAQYGYAVGTAGDVNGDGFSDVLVGAPFWEDGTAYNEGRVWLYHGSHGGLRESASWHAESNQFGARMGFAVATAGDVNGDGYSDVLVSAPYWGDAGLTSEGKVWVFHGSGTGLNTSHAWTRESGQNDAYYGYSVGTAGDVNGDGFADVLIGAPHMTGADGTSDEGLVRLYQGSAAGLESSYAWTGEGNQTLSWYGGSVASAGDVNGDGYADLVIGADQYNEALVNEGKVFVYYGNGRSGVPLALRQLNNTLQPVALLGRTDSDSFRVNLTVSTPFGRGKFKEEIEVKPLGVRFNGDRTLRRAAWACPVLPASAIVEAGDLRYGVPYHWRIRILYNPATTPWMPASRWVTVPWNGWNEQDLRTPGSSIYLPLVFRNY